MGPSPCAESLLGPNRKIKDPSGFEIWRETRTFHSSDRAAWLEAVLAGALHERTKKYDIMCALS
jgi:cobalamin biosynthesis protein CobD/CbiB